jgi:hypothetical protein
MIYCVRVCVFYAGMWIIGISYEHDLKMIAINSNEMYHCFSHIVVSAFASKGYVTVTFIVVVILKYS